MLTYPGFDPIALDLGVWNLPGIGSAHLAVRWYGLMYLIGFVGGWWVLRRRAAARPLGWSDEQVADLVFHAALGVVLGGRVGYILIYNFAAFLADPSLLLRVWEGGMSFHGGLLGVLVAMWWYGRREQRGFFALTDFIAPAVPIGLGAGRLGNFINGELWGKAADVPWALVVAGVPRHATQLYELALEGVVLFTVLNLYARRPRPTMAVSGLFALLYGAFRCCAEVWRMPDEQLGYLYGGWLTMGILLSVPLMLVGATLLALAYRTRPAA